MHYFSLKLLHHNNCEYIFSLLILFIICFPPQEFKLSEGNFFFVFTHWVPSGLKMICSISQRLKYILNKLTREVWIKTYETQILIKKKLPKRKSYIYIYILISVTWEELYLRKSTWISLDCINSMKIKNHSSKTIS